MGSVKIISASAGSGKTYRLAYEYVKSVVRDPSLYRRILAVTFTNKATEEMSSRILERLHELASGAASPYSGDLLRDLAPLDEAQIRARAAEAQKLILHDYSRFAVLTIDRFFQRLIRSFMRELGVEADFSLELETDSLLELAADALIDGAATDEKLRGRIFAAARDRLDEGRHRSIREPLMALGAELFGEEYRRAHEGTATGTAGDTGSVDAPTEAATLIEAVAKRAEEARTGLSEKAGQMLRTIEQYGLTAGDFKGKSKGLVAYLTRVAGGEFAPLSNYARRELESESLLPQLRQQLAGIDTLYRENFRLVGSVRLLRENHHNFLMLSDLQAAVERICREENIVPISETGRMIARLVGGNDTPFIFEKAGSYFSRFFIDEFQDTSLSQWENFVPLLQNAIASEEGTPVMLIGDIKQAIYRWRGGDWQILSRRVREEMGPGRVEVETLDVNYRSMRRVVEFNNAAVGRVVEAGVAALDATIAGARAEGSLTAVEAGELTGMLGEAYLGHIQIPQDAADEGYVTLTVYGADGEGRYVPPVIERIEELQSRGYAAGDIAVLVRSNTQGARVARMLLERKRENPDSPYRYDVVTAEALRVGASEASRFIVACLSLSVDPDDTIQRAVYNRWTGRGFDEPLSHADAAFFARIASLSPEEAFEETVLRFDMQGRSADIAYIQAVHQQITTFSSRSVADIPLFLKWWNERGAAASITMQAGGGAITVSTIHKAKGLQYRAVIVPYLSWSMAPDTRGRGLVVWADSSEGGLAGVGAMPINYKEQMAGSYFSARYYREQVLAHIDAANLFYVAATRAEQELHLMVSSNPRDGKNTIGNLLRTVLGITREVTTWGSPLHPAGGVTTADRALKTYPTSRPGAKVHLRLPSSRYFGDGSEEGEGAALSPRDFGVLMHRAFENAVGAADVHRALDVMLSDGLVSRSEYARLQEVVGRAFENPLVAGWFGGEWTEVRNEGDIVLPQGKQAAGARVGPVTRRPDRVMMRGERAVVVDYKFGRARPASHAAALRDYMRLLREMGCADVEGYLWYVSLDEIVPVRFS